MLEIFDQADKADLLRADWLLRNWLRWGRGSRRQNVSPLWRVMNSGRTSSRNEPANPAPEERADIWNDLVKPDSQLALEIERLFCSDHNHLWQGHFGEKEALLTYYRRDRKLPYGVMMRKLQVKTHQQLHERIIKALRFFNTIYKEEKCSD